jgi:hypothetical protein
MNGRVKNNERKDSVKVAPGRRAGSYHQCLVKEHAGELGSIARHWFEVMRNTGDEVRELLHDGCPVVCLGDRPD